MSDPEFTPKDPTVSMADECLLLWREAGCGFRQSRPEPEPIATGLPGLDRPEGGLRPGELILLWGAPPEPRRRIVAWLLARAAGAARRPCLLLTDCPGLFLEQQVHDLLEALDPGLREWFYGGARSPGLDQSLDAMDRIHRAHGRWTLAYVRATARRFFVDQPPPGLLRQRRRDGLIILDGDVTAWPGRDIPPIDAATLCGLGLARLATELGVPLIWSGSPRLHDLHQDTGLDPIPEGLAEHADRVLRISGGPTPGDPRTPFRLEVRRQGEAEAGVTWLRIDDQGVTVADPPVVEPPGVEETDLYRRAKDLASRTHRISAGLIQRELHCGYNLAAHLLDRMQREERSGSPPGEPGPERVDPAPSPPRRSKPRPRGARPGEAR